MNPASASRQVGWLMSRPKDDPLEAMEEGRSGADVCCTLYYEKSAQERSISACQVAKTMIVGVVRDSSSAFVGRILGNLVARGGANLAMSAGITGTTLTVNGGRHLK